MEERYHINEMIMDTSIKIVGLDNEILTISLDLADFYNYSAIKYYKESQQKKIDVGDIAKTLHPYAIYNTLENTGKNTYSNTKIIEKIETPDFIEYHFNYGLILNVFINDKNKNILEFIKERISKLAFINPIYFSYNIIGDSSSIPQDKLSEFTKDYGYKQKPYRSIFKKEVRINYSCLERVSFSNCEFESKISLHRLKGSAEFIEFHNGINFENCIFGGEVEFGYFVSGTLLPENKYHNNARETNFKNCIFKKRVDFFNSKICNNIYFTNSIFKDFADFHECEFEKTACFYGVEFKKVPNFSQVQFKGSLNAVNTNLDFDFDELEAKIKQEHNNDNKKSLDKFANDFRDSFRGFKSALMKDNNLLDASEFHKYELYCKEIELKHKGKKTLKEKIDYWQLVFYRITSDHHTDLLKILGWILYCIAIFAGVLFYHRYQYDLMLFMQNHEIQIKLLNYLLPWISIKCLVVFCFLLILLSILHQIFRMAIGFVITFAVVAINPKYILGIGGLISGSIKINGMFENIIFVVYTIIMFLLIFSLQKTARKNSIVPN